MIVIEKYNFFYFFGGVYFQNFVKSGGDGSFQFINVVGYFLIVDVNELLICWYGELFWWFFNCVGGQEFGFGSYRK